MSDDDRLDLSTWTAPPPPAGLTDRALDRLAGRVSAHARPDPAPRRRWRWAIAGAALAAAAAGTAIVVSREPPTRAGGTGGVTATAATAVELADGVEALIEAGAAITWTTDAEVVRVTHRAGVVTYRQRGARRLAITTPAATLSSARATFRVEAPMNRTLVAGAVVGLAGVVAIIVYDGSVEAERPAAPAQTLTPGAETRLAIAPTDAPTEARPVAVAKAAVDRVRRAQVAQAIAAARARPAGGAGAVAGVPAGTVGTAPPVDDATPGELTKDEIRAGVRDVVPLIAECYDLELAKDPTVREATVKARFTIDSAADVGTVVTVGDLAIDGRLGDSQEFRDCMTATLEAVVLPPLGDGGSIEVNYPFLFRATDGAEDGDGDEAAAPPPTPPTAPARKRTPAPPPTAPTPAAGSTVDALAEAAQEAALNGRWAQAAEVADRALAAGATGAARSRLINIAALASCRIGRYDDARRFRALAAPWAHPVIDQACAQASGGKYTPTP